MRTWLSSLALAAAVAGYPLGAALAQSSAPVYCGTVTCFQFRVAAQGKDPDARASSAMDTINKYLGGSVGKVTTRPAGQNVEILLNNEKVALVTAADAAAEKQKSAAALAAKWSKVLATAFNQTKAQP